MAETSGRRAHQLLWRPLQQQSLVSICGRSEADVAEVTETAKPAAQNDVVALQSVGD
ncbi:hypothetical protein LG003_15160 [Photorhabdus kleinii]|nr:hypothetical protein [Photorhabdus kleinii]MCT8344142.1 hypothetical protein [Photorhabdus kleinii]